MCGDNKGPMPYLWRLTSVMPRSAREAVSLRLLAPDGDVSNIVASARTRQYLRRGASREEHATLYKETHALLS